MLEHVLKELRSIPHVEIMRFGSRTPVVMPQRITPDLCKMIAKYHPIYVSVHFNHPREITESPIKVVLRNFEGSLYTYSQPARTIDSDRVCPLCRGKHKDYDVGVAQLLNNKAIAMEPVVKKE